mmetsp:Transcript_9340/g.24466  ORF Transcript_9340/g.24466 Transcript_9340/m.24466 type:complete len:236 (+) Transcript_9340:1528-2235(+)
MRRPGCLCDREGCPLLLSRPGGQLSGARHRGQRHRAGGGPPVGAPLRVGRGGRPEAPERLLVGPQQHGGGGPDSRPPRIHTPEELWGRFLCVDHRRFALQHNIQPPRPPPIRHPHPVLLPNLCHKRRRGGRLLGDGGGAGGRPPIAAPQPPIPGLRPPHPQRELAASRQHGGGGPVAPPPLPAHRGQGGGGGLLLLLLLAPPLPRRALPPSHPDLLPAHWPRAGHGLLCSGDSNK